MAQRYKFSIESKSFPLDISGEPNYKAYENELLNRNLYKHTIGYSKWMGNLVSLNISWRLSRGSKHNSAEKRINLRDTDNGIIK